MRIFNIKPATWALFVIVFISILAASIAGCTTDTIVRADRMAYCDADLDTKLLSEPCGSSIPLTEGATFQDGLSGKRSADSALEQCHIKTQKLQEALAACHKATDTYNSTIDALNKK